MLMLSCEDFSQLVHVTPTHASGLFPYGIFFGCVALLKLHCDCLPSSMLRSFKGGLLVRSTKLFEVVT